MGHDKKHLRSSCKTRVMPTTLCRMIMLATRWLYLITLRCSCRMFSAMIPSPPKNDHPAKPLNGGADKNLDWFYAASPRLTRYSIGLREPREILIRFSLYQRM